jgi:hypothetical protein
MGEAKTWRLLTTQDSAGEGGAQETQIKGSRGVAPVETIAFGDRLDGCDFAVQQHPAPVMGTGDRFDESRILPRRSLRTRRIPHICTPTSKLRPYRQSEDQIRSIFHQRLTASE